MTDHYATALRSVQSALNDNERERACLVQSRRAIMYEAISVGGLTHANIAEATGLSRGRVGQIAKQR